MTVAASAMDDKDRADINKAKVDTVIAAVDAGLADADEGRSIPNADEEGPFFGSLPGAAPDLPEPYNDDSDEDDDLATAAE